MLLAAIVTVVLFVYYSHKADSRHDPRSIQDFYHKTMDGMKKDSPPGQAVINSNTGARAGHIPADKDADGDVDEDDKKASTQMQMRLKAAEQAAKDKANEKAGPKPDPPSNIVGKGSSAEGQVKKEAKADSKVDIKPVRKETKEEHDTEVELAAILKQSPGKQRTFLFYIWERSKEIMANACLFQSSFSPRRTVPTRSEPRVFSSKNTPSRHHRTWSNWMSMPWARTCRIFCWREPAAGRYLTF